jgi:hypothetical protein
MMIFRLDIAFFRIAISDIVRARSTIDSYMLEFNELLYFSNQTPIYISQGEVINILFAPTVLPTPSR